MLFPSFHDLREEFMEKASESCKLQTVKNTRELPNVKIECLPTVTSFEKAGSEGKGVSMHHVSIHRLLNDIHNLQRFKKTRRMTRSKPGALQALLWLASKGDGRVLAALA